MRGITVTLYERTATSSVDGFGHPVYTETAVEIGNVLVAPAETGGDPMFTETDLKSRKAVYTLGLPKGDTHVWENCKVTFFGKTFRVIGMPTEGIESLIPLSWNKKVTVEAIE